MPNTHSVYMLIVVLTNKEKKKLSFLKTVELKQYGYVFYPNIVHLLTFSKRNGEWVLGLYYIQSEVHCRLTHGSWPKAKPCYIYGYAI